MLEQDCQHPNQVKEGVHNYEWLMYAFFNFPCTPGAYYMFGDSASKPFNISLKSVNCNPCVWRIYTYADAEEVYDLTCFNAFCCFGKTSFVCGCHQPRSIQVFATGHE